MRFRINVINNDKCGSKIPDGCSSLISQLSAQVAFFNVQYKNRNIFQDGVKIEGAE